MSDGEKRKAICHHCILVKGFKSDTSFSVIKSIFPESCRGELLARSASFEPRQKEWIVQFLSVKVVEKTSVRMSDGEKRKAICHHCILVKGFKSDTSFSVIKSIFPESCRRELLARSANFEPRQKEWIVQFLSVDDVQMYTEFKIHKTADGILDISPCELSCDIPDDWLQDSDVHKISPVTNPTTFSADHPSSGYQDERSAPTLHQHSGSMGQPEYLQNYDPRFGPQFLQHPGYNQQHPAFNPQHPAFNPYPGYNPQQFAFNPHQPGYNPQHPAFNPQNEAPPPYDAKSPGKDKEQTSHDPQQFAYWQRHQGGYYPPHPVNRYSFNPNECYGYEQQQTTSTSQKPQQNLEQKTENDASNVPNNRTTEGNSNTESNDVRKSVAEKEEEEHKQTTTNMLKVNKLPVGTTEDSLEFFFENTRKYGGGDVERVEYDEDTSSAIITFVEDDAVDKVLQKMPILFNKKVVEVEAYTVNDEDALDIREEKFYDCDEDPQEDDITCTIEVREMKPSTSKDTIMYYFESRKGANTDVEKIQFIQDKNMYLVTFEEEEGVNRALEKSHMVDGAKLQVRKHVPPKRYPNKALIKGLSEKTSEDGLINFLEAKTKKDVATVDFGDEDSKKAIVTFDQSIDIDQLQTTCQKKSLDGSFVTIHPVFVTNCIIVRGYSENTTEDRLEWYFENKKKSGVEGVTEIKIDKEEDYCIIYFQDSKDALIACQRKHIVDNCKLQVQVFYDCLGIPASDEGSKFTNPPPIIIDSIDKRKINFFLHSKSSKAALEKQLHDLHGQITWPSDEDIKLKIECTLTKETKDCRRLAKTWKADTKKQIDSFVDNLDIEKHTPLQEAWHLVMEKLREIKIENPDRVTVSVEKPPTCEIYIVGLHIAVEEVSDKVKAIIEEVTDELNTKKQQIQEEVTLKHFQLLILVFIHFPDKIKNRFDNMEVKINTKKHVITFNGISKDITSAKVFMFETVNNIVKAPIGKKSQIFIKFLKEPEVGAFVGRKIKEKGLVGVWDIQDNSVMMYSISDEDAVAAADIFKESLTETKVDVEDLQKPMLNSHKWTAHAQSIKDEYQQKSIITKIVVDQGQITLLCTSKGEAGIIREKIQDFFLMNTENEIIIDLPPAQLKFLQEHMKDEVEKLECTLKQKNVIIAVKSDGILVKGNQQGVKDAADEVDSLVQKIYKMKHPMDKPGLPELMQTYQGKQKLKQVGRQADVVISNESDEDEKSTGRDIHPRSTGSASEGTVYTTNWGQEVIVVQGDIIALDVDVIVNAANKDLVHSGGLAKVLVKKGGPSIQTECAQYIKVNGQLSEGEVFCSGPGNLKCQIIIHAVGPAWQGGGNQEEDHLYCCIESALKESENRNLSSIAIPALCTGIFGYPSKEATKVICEAIKDYFKVNQASTVETVYLCDIADKNVNFFQKAGNKFFNTDHSRKPVGGQQGDKFSGGSSSDISMGNIKIKILKGELAKMRVDAIVNTTSTDLKLNKGAVSATLLNKGGPTLQQECSQKYPNGVRYGEVAVTSGGQLQCQIVCHGSLDQWRKDGSSIKVLENFVMGCLATADKKKCQSIALPAMGTGQLGYPKELVASHMYSCVEQFASKNPKSSITEVIFVLYHKDYPTVKAFEDEERDRQSTAHGRHDRNLTETPTTYQGRATKPKTKKPQKQKEAALPPDTSDQNKIYCVNMGSLTFKVYQGDITAVQVEAIVNGTNSDLDLTLGGVSKAIKAKGGKELQKQLDRQRTLMKNDGIAVTCSKTKQKSPKGLMCDVVIHVDMSGINADNQSGGVFSVFSAKLKDKIKLVLDKADELKMRQVALPALGTSAKSKIPVSQTAEEIFKVVEKFNSKPNKNVKEIHVVIFQQDMMKEFMEAIKKCVSRSPQDKVYMGRFLNWTGFGSGDKKVKVPRHERHLVGAQVPVSSNDPTSVTFVIYARDKGTAQNAIRMLEKSIEDDYIEKPVSARIIKEFNDDQISKVKKLAETGKVKVVIDKDQGQIKLQGLINNVSDAVSEANEIIRSADREKQTKQKAKIVTDMVQWYYMEQDKAKNKTTLKEYPSEVNLILETALKDQKPTASFYSHDGSKYIVDLNSYEEYPDDDPTDSVKVLRKSKLVDHTFEPPQTWSAMDDKDNLKMVPLSTTDKEYTDVTTKFKATSDGVNVEFVKVERVQNKILFQQYVAKKKSMDATNPKGCQNERELWHGFSVDALDSICKYGFNRSYCGKNATALGAGVYFAVNVNYSIQDPYSRPDANRHKRMFLCKVLTGEFCQGKSSLMVPPAKPSAAGSHILYDTVTNDVSNPIMFVIFHDSQAVPEYLVTFKRK